MEPTLSSRRWRMGAALLGLLGLTVAVTATADAAPIPANRMTTPKTPTAMPRAQCSWPGTLPALPAGCAAPTLAQCLDTAYLATACGTSDAVRKHHCQKLLFDEYCKGGKEEELVFPIANPKKAPVHGLQAGTPSLFIPPGQAMGGRQMPFVGLTKDGKAPPRTPNGVTALSEHSGATAIVLSGNGMGTYGSATAGQWMLKSNAVRTIVHGLHVGLVNSGGTVSPQLEAATNGLFSQFDAESSWVGNGSDTAQNRAVNSCAEYTYQRWYDYGRFKNAAKALARDYRGIFALATEPSSPVYLEKAQLKQFAIGNLPASWPVPNAYKDPTTELARNVFFTSPTLLIGHNGLTEAKADAIKARVDKWQNSSSTKYIKLPAGSGGTRFELHKRMKQQIDSRYRLSDDQFDERQARQDRYLELVASREELAPQLACATLPHACCNAPPTNTPNQLQGLLAKVKGWAVINPDPTKFSNWGADVGPIDLYNSFVGAEQVQLASAIRSMKGSPAGLDGKLQGNINVGVKQKAPPGQATQGAAASVTVNTSKTGSTGGQSCEAVWASKKPSLTAAMSALSKQLSDLVVKEYDAGAEGCLGEPTGGDLGNSCDWSYQKFSRFVMTYFDAAVQQSFDQCNDATLGDFATMRDPTKQPHVFPCELRHNFTEDQVDAAYYIEATPQKGRRFTCEGQRAQRDVDAYLKQNAALVEKIPVKPGDKIGESSADKWTIGDADTFGAFLDFAVGWEMYGSGNQRLSDGAWCKPVGSASMRGSAGFHFFGTPLTVVEGKMTEETLADGAYYAASARYRDLDRPTNWKELFNELPRTKAWVPTLQIPGGFALLGDVRADFWASVGPVPLHIFFGGTAMAGMNVKELGTPTQGDSCNTPTKPSESVAMNYTSGTEFEPWARADAYGDASLDVGVAAAGLHIDLLLLRLGLPTGASVTAPSGAMVKMQSGSNLSVDALSGRVSAYVRIGVPPLSSTFETTLFAWDGLHDQTLLWGSEVSAPMKLVTWTAKKEITSDQITCLTKQNPTVNVPRNYCLKNPTTAANCSPYPAETFCDASMKPYRLRGTP